MQRCIMILILSAISVSGWPEVIARDANGQKIGIVSGQEQWYFSIVTPTQFTVRIQAESGQIQGDFVYFLETDCAGVPYLAQTYSNAVIRNGNAFWYGNGNAVQDVEFLSYNHPSTDSCVNQTVPEPSGVEAVPNDPAVTGVPNGLFVAPFRIELDSAGGPCVFNDRFECSMD